MTPTYPLSAAAVAVAVVYAWFVPGGQRVRAATGPLRLVARWCHSLTWLVLATAPLLHHNAGARPARLAALIAAAGYVVYLLALWRCLNPPTPPRASTGAEARR